jgi:hypothetical protein
MNKFEMLDEVKDLVMATTEGQTNALLNGYAQLYGMTSGLLTETQVEALLEFARTALKKS